MAEERLHLILSQEEDYWKQHSKLFWLQSGDSNTHAFHKYESNKKRKNSIQKQKGHDDIWYEKGKGLEDVIQGYF